MKFFKNTSDTKRAVFADNPTQRPFTVNNVPVKLIAIRKSRRILRKGKTQYIYSIGDKIYYNENQDHYWFSEFADETNNHLYYRAFTNPTNLDKIWLEQYGYHVLGQNEPETEKHVKCCLLKPDESNPDGKFQLQNENGEEVDVSDIDDWPNKWPDGIITFRFVSKSDDLKSKLQDRILAVAIRAIGLRTKNIEFERVYDEAVDPDLEIIFDSNHTEFVKNPNALAFAWLPTNNPRTSRFSGLVVFSDDWDWDIYGRGGKQSMLHTLMHELLHALGFRHDERDMDSILYPIAIKKKIVFSKRDLVRVWNKYGKRLLPERWINYFIDRRLRGYEFDRFI